MFDKLINQKGFSLDRLATLCDIAGKGSIQAATKNNATRQGQYSRQIKELEKFLGFDLLDRSRRPSPVTQEGWEISQLSQNFMSSLETFLEDQSQKPLSRPRMSWWESSQEASPMDAPSIWNGARR